MLLGWIPVLPSQKKKKKVQGILCVATEAKSVVTVALPADYGSCSVLLEESAVLFESTGKAVSSCGNPFLTLQWTVLFLSPRNVPSFPWHSDNPIHI